MYNLQKVRKGIFLKNRLVHPATLTSVLQVQFSIWQCRVQCTVQYSEQYSIQFSVQYSIGIWGVHVLIVLKLARQLEPTLHLYYLVQVPFIRQYYTVQCTVQYSVQYSIQCNVQYSIGIGGVHVLMYSVNQNIIAFVLACLGNVQYTVVYCTVYSTVQCTVQYTVQFSVEYMCVWCPCTHWVATSKKI